MIVNDLLNFFYKLIIWINQNIFERLNIDTRIEAFVGVISVLVAIVIFIAETVNNNKIETQKRFVIEKTKMKKIMNFSILTLSFCIIKELVPYSRECGVISNILFFIVELFSNFFIGFSIYLTIKLFCVSLKLNINSDYFNNEYDEYIKRRLDDIHKKNIYYSEKKLEDEEFDLFIMNNRKYFELSNDLKEDYYPIKANKSGIFKKYSCRTLQTIIDKMKEKELIKTEFEIGSDAMIVLCLKGEEKVNRGVTIAYCKYDYSWIFDVIRNSLLFDDSIPYQDNEINLILSDLYELASKNKEDDFDNNRRLYNYYDYLYKNDMYSILNLSFEYIRQIYKEYCDKIHSNKELVNFLSKLASLAYYNEDYDHYKFACDYMYYCIFKQLELSDDIREVALDFSDNIFGFNYFSIKDNKDVIYYDVILSKFMGFLFDLIQKKEYIAIDDLFQNILFDYDRYVDCELRQYDIIKLQFSFGFIYGLLVLSNKKAFNSKDKPYLKKIIDEIKMRFVDVLDISSVIQYFKRYYHKQSSVQNVYYNFDFRFENMKYRHSWSGTVIDEIIVLKSFIYIFDINYFSNETIENELISKDNKYFFERFIDLIKKGSKNNLEDFLDISYDNNNLITLLEQLKNKCQQEELKYIKENEIDFDKIEKFKQLIIKEYNNGNKLLNYLKKCKKYDVSDKKSKKYFGFNQIVGRDLFFKEVYGIENLSKNYGQSILTEISQKYIRKLDEISEIVKEDIDVFSKCLKKDKYVIITGPINRKIVHVNNYESCEAIVGNKKMDLVFVSGMTDIYLIKKSELLAIDMLSIDLKENESTTPEMYFNLKDCSTDKITRKEIQKNNDWLKDYGNKNEQMEYLKGKCIFKLFVSPSIINSKKSRCYRFIIRDGEL